MKRLTVFVSSPGDTAAERDIVIRVLERNSQGETARKLRIDFQALRWEDWPPGAGEPGDAQQHINRILKQAGLEYYDIYLGMMKGRVGTPTPRAASGTIEEFEVALLGRKKRLRPMMAW